jgi:hypothetical protein
MRPSSVLDMQDVVRRRDVPGYAQLSVTLPPAERFRTHTLVAELFFYFSHVITS